MDTTETNSLENAFVQVVQVQEGITDAQARNKLASCGFKAFMVFLKTRDQGKAMTAFVSCLFGVNIDPSNPNQPDSDTPIYPGSVNRSVSRCS